MVGDGGQGKVYKSGELFAIKLFPVLLFHDPNCLYSLDWFMNEIVCYSKIAHPNILNFLAWSFDDTFYYIAMPIGIPLEIAFQQNLITIDTISFGLIFAILY